MAKTASHAVEKWQLRAQQASTDYVEGAKTTDKDQAQRAIAAKTIWQQALQESFTRDAYAKGLQKAGKQGWLSGVEEKGAQNFTTGISASKSRALYMTNSGRYDPARKAADSIPRGPRGSAQNLNRVAAVVNALRAAKVGKA